MQTISRKEMDQTGSIGVSKIASVELIQLYMPEGTRREGCMGRVSKQKENSSFRNI